MSENQNFPPDAPTIIAANPSVATPAPANASASGKAITALILGIASLLCCGFMAGIPAFFVGRSEESDINQGRSPEAGRTLAKIGWILGLIGTLLSCLGTILYAVFIWIAIKNGHSDAVKF